MVSWAANGDTIRRPGATCDGVGARLKVMILANRDPTSSTIFHAVCEDPRLEVICIAFTQSLTKSKGFWRGVHDIFRRSGLSYFTYISFWNGIFLVKEWLILQLPVLKRVFHKFLSLRLWAREYGVKVVSSTDFNSQEFLGMVAQFQPDVIFTRINQILEEPILRSAKYGCWCFHSSELPRYQGIAAEFHSMLNGEKTVGFTVMQMKRKLDAGPIIAQGTTPIADGTTLHGLINHNNTYAHAVIRRAVDDLTAGDLRLIPQNPLQKSYYSWPTPEQTRAFHRKKLHYISFHEVLTYILE